MSQSREEVYRLLAILGDGEVHSGESLGEHLGVTRAAVWKRLQSLKELGLQVNSVKGQGYALTDGADLLQSEKIKQQLKPQALQRITELKYFFEIDSTNQYLLQRESRHGVVCLAESQTAGRGRRGREWVSPFAANIYLSIRWHFSEGVTALEGLSLAVGVAIAQVLQNSGLEQVKLKWPNDVLFNGAKLGGVLVEVGGDLTGECAVVIGIGLNVNMPEQASGIEQAWTDLRRQGVTTSRNDLSAELINELTQLLATYPSQKFAHYRSQWLSFAAYLNESVTLVSGKQKRVGVFRDVNEHGAFAFEVDGKVEWVSGGEISLRGVDDQRA